MHEFALAEAVIDTAIRSARKAGIARIERIEVHVGELQKIERETFEFALREVIPAVERSLESASIEVVTEPAAFSCRPCGRRFDLADARRPDSEDVSEAIHFVPELAHSFLRCPGCGSPDFEVVRGRGVTIHSIDGESE